MSSAGVALSVADFVTGINLQNQHWSWIAAPLMHILAVAAALDLIMRWKPTQHMPAWVCALLVSAYLANGIYLTGSIHLIGARSHNYAGTIYSEYKQQRLVAGVPPLRPDAVIAGDANFVDLASAAERQRPLAGGFLENNMLFGDAERRTRFVLDRYLSGSNRESLAVLLNDSSIPPERFGAYLDAFDKVSRDSERFINALRVRYLVLPATQRAPVFVNDGWHLIQPGPYWQIWGRG
jgi:hypothetical protein